MYTQKTHINRTEEGSCSEAACRAIVGDLDAKRPKMADAPDDLRCPISLELMRDPVRTVDGHCYERESIVTWFAEHEGQDDRLLPPTMLENRAEPLADITTKDAFDVQLSIERWEKARKEGLFGMARLPDTSITFTEQKLGHGTSAEVFSGTYKFGKQTKRAALKVYRGTKDENMLTNANLKQIMKEVEVSDLCT